MVSINGNGIPEYPAIRDGVAALVETARHTAARAVNHQMVATYWEIGRRIVEFEQSGSDRAAYGEKLLLRLAKDLTEQFGRGFGFANLHHMRRFFLEFQILQTVSVELPSGQSATEAPIFQTVSEKLPSGQSASGIAIRQTVAAEWTGPAALSALNELAAQFPLPWSHYVRLLAVKNPEGRKFYETEALRGGWTVRQLERQIGSQFYERTLLSRNKAAMLRKGAAPLPEDMVSPEEEIKDPFVLEFLNLRDEYSETDLEDALVQHLESFLLELGGDFAFLGRQRRLRIGNEWYRVDLLFFHRKLRCLVVIDLKLGRFTHADAGQMHLYLNYAREHWSQPDENPPVGLILCAEKDEAVAHYALEGLPNKVLAAEYRMTLPDEKELAAEIERTRLLLEAAKNQ